MNDWTGTNTFELNLLGRFQKMTDHKGNTVSYAYDAVGNLLKQSGPTKGEEDSWQYNDLNQMVSKHSCGYEQKQEKHPDLD